MEDVGSSGEAATEFLALYEKLISVDHWKYYLALKGVLGTISTLLTKVCVMCVTCHTLYYIVNIASTLNNDYFSFTESESFRIFCSITIFNFK